MAMKQIPIAEQSLLCASIYVNSFKRVIEELVFNSLDAASSSIAVRVCIQDNFIQVLDNGIGIFENSFTLLGQKYTTSKYVDMIALKSAPNKYGFRGLSLASIIDVSQYVNIISRHETSNDTWMKTFFNGQEKEICKTASRPSQGTTVEIKGFLYNLNIQRKSIDPQNELQNIKMALKQLSFVHCNVSISLRDDSKNDIILQIHKNRSMRDTIQTVFHISEKDFYELQVEKNDYKLEAFIGKNVTESNNCHQWIYINSKFIHKSILHRKLNKSYSNFFNTKNIRTCEDGNNIYLNYNIPFYFIFITCPNNDVVINYNSEKSLIEFKDWKEVNNLLEKLVHFYSGCLVAKKQTISKITNVENKSNTRTEVKRIMEKILNRKNNPTRISQLQNGVKGKILKRNRKKKDLSMQRIINQKAETFDLCQLKDCLKGLDFKISKEQLKQKPIIIQKKKDLKVPKIIKSNKQNAQTLKKNFNSGFNSDCSHALKMLNNSSKCNNRRNAIPIITKKKKTKKVVKKDKYMIDKDLLIQKFALPNKTLKKRIDSLRRKVLTLHEKKNCRHYVDNTVYSFINNETRFDTKNTTSLTLCHKTDKNLKMCNTNVHISKNNINKHKVNNLDVKKSYDLVKTVIKDFMSNDKCITSHNTYNSHINNVGALKRMGYFISDISRDNFFLHEPELFSVTNKYHYIKPKLLAVNHKSGKKVSNNDLFNRYHNLDPQRNSYTIEMTKSHDMINSMHISNIMDFSLAKESNYVQILPNFKNTLIPGNCSRISNLINNYTLNKTYSLQICNSLSFRYSKERRTSSFREILTNKSSDVQVEKENCIIPESEYDPEGSVHHSIEPIYNCEDVLYNHSYELRDLEKEFENSFVNKRDSIIGSYNNIFNNSRKSLEQKDNRIVSIKALNNLGHEPNLLKLDNNSFQIKSRYHFIPKGMSPLADNRCELQNAYSSNGDEIYYKDMIYKNFAKDVLINTEIFEPELEGFKNILSANHIGKVNINIHKENADLLFNTLSLTQAKVLGQVDRKYIASVLNNNSAQLNQYSEFLVLFDQHAVDERIRLEINLLDYIQDCNWKGVDIDPISIVLNKDDYLYFVNHRDKLARFGLQWTFTSEYEILLNAIPKAILGKHSRQVEIVIKSVKKLISEQIRAIKTLKGNVSLYPKSIMELVFSEACRSAIKFGDKLSIGECSKMVNLLARCKTPFQCAHGRPVMAVLTELKSNNQTYKVDMTKVKKFRMMPQSDKQDVIF